MGRQIGLLRILLLFAGMYVGSEGAKILCVSHQFGSHMLMLHTVAEGLIERGHEVYTVYSDRMKVPKGLQEKGFKILTYHTREGSNIMASDANSNMVVEEMLHGRDSDMAFQSQIGLEECLDMDHDATLGKKINELNIDLVLVDVFPLSSCMMFIPLRHNIPFVLVPPHIDMEMMRTPALPSFMPGVLMSASENMSFAERLKSTLFAIMLSVPALTPFTSVKDLRLLIKYNKDPNVKAWTDLARKTELFLVSRGPILEYPTPLQPNIINIECLTCKPGKPLDNNIEAMVSQAEGVIVVSFGSLVDEFPDYVAEKLLKAFAQRKELIFMRYKHALSGTVPPNVKVMKWLPQNDLLAHPKTKLFITHSGNNGQYESVYHGVPMLAFPIFAEQPHNAHRMVYHGYGLQCDLRTFTSEELAEKMAEIIDNPSYRERTQKAGRIMKSMPMDPRQLAAYWIEHVLEFSGDHLRSHALKMTWYSYYMIDILLFLEVLVIIFLSLFICMCSYIIRRLSASKTKEKVH